MNSIRNFIIKRWKKYTKITLITYASYSVLYYYNPILSLYSFYKKGIINWFTEILSSDEVKKSGLEKVENIFKNKELISIQLDQLKKAVTSDAVKEESIIFSKKWIINVFKTKEFIDYSKVYFGSISKERSVSSLAITDIEGVIRDNIVRNEYANICKRATLNNFDTFDSMIKVLSKAGVYVISTNALKKEVGKVSSEVITRPEFLEALINSSKNIKK